MRKVTAIVGHVACEAVTNWHGVAAAVAAEELQPIATTPFSEGNQPKIGEKIDEDAAALAAASLACTSGQSTRCTSTVAVLFATGLKWPEKTSVCESGVAPRVWRTERHDFVQKSRRSAHEALACKCCLLGP